MPLKVSINTVAMLRTFPEIQRQFNADVTESLGDELDKQIKAGLSPVAGEGRFKDYSDSYKDAIDRNEGVMKGSDGGFWTEKKKRPVNLSVSGAMLKSRVIKTQGNTVKVTYGSKIAGYHNEGNDKLPRRALLPTGMGEKFSTTITRFLVGRARIIVDKILKGNL